jgi:hypothetical protein
MREWKRTKMFIFIYSSTAHKDAVELVTLATECLKNASTKDLSSRYKSERIQNIFQENNQDFKI